MTSILRPASFFERYQIFRTDHNYYLNFNITAEYPVEVTKEKLSNALFNIIKENPILGCNFFGDNSLDDDYKNFGLMGIPLTYDSVVYQTEYDPVPEFFEFLNSIHFDVNCDKPLWRLYIKDNRITLCCNHGFFDGNVGAFFHKELLKQLTELPDNLEFKEKLNGDVTSLPGFIDSLYKPSFWFTLTTVIKSYIPTWIKRILAYFSYPNVYKYPRFQPSQIQIGQHTDYRILKISKEQTKSILSFTRASGTKFTPWFASIIQSSFQKIHPNKTMSYSIPLNGRRYLDFKKFPVQNLVAASDFSIEPGTNPTKVASYVSDRLNKDLKTREPFFLAGMLNLVSVSNYIKAKIGTYGRVTFEISNVGQLPMPCWFSQDNGFLSYLQYNVFSSPEGMNIVIGGIDVDLELIVDTLQKDIDEFVEGL